MEAAEFFGAQIVFKAGEILSSDLLVSYRGFATV